MPLPFYLLYREELPYPGDNVLIVAPRGKFAEGLASRILGPNLNYDVEIGEHYQHYRFYWGRKLTEVVLLYSPTFQQDQLVRGTRISPRFFNNFELLIWCQQHRSTPHFISGDFWEGSEASCRDLLARLPFVAAPGRFWRNAAVPCRVLMLAFVKEFVFRHSVTTAPRGKRFANF